MKGTFMHKVPITLFSCFLVCYLLLGNTVYGKQNRFPSGYCTWYAAEEFNKIAPEPGINWSGNAGNWFRNAGGWATNNQPMSAEKGAIIVWLNNKDDGKPGYGHVGIVESVDWKSNRVTISEMNWGPIKPGTNKEDAITANFDRVTTETLSLDNLDRGRFYFQGFIYPRKLGEQVFTGEYGGDCVAYVKSQNPGGYEWGGKYKDKKGDPVNEVCFEKEWDFPSEIWSRLLTISKGVKPRVHSVLVLGGSTNHVAIVTKVEGNRIYVRHSNWQCQDRGWVSEGYFTTVGDGRYVTYNDSTRRYVLLGFIYVPK